MPQREKKPNIVSYPKINGCELGNVEEVRTCSQDMIYNGILKYLDTSPIHTEERRVSALLQFSIDETGEIVDFVTVSGNEELLERAIDATKKWYQSFLRKGNKIKPALDENQQPIKVDLSLPFILIMPE